MELLAENGAALLFYLFAALAVGGALLVVVLRNPMYGALALLTSFLAVAALFFLRHAEFVGVVQIFVYGGGIMVLFLFVIMLVNLHSLPEARGFWAKSLPALAVALLLALVLGFALSQAPLGAPADPGLASFTEVATPQGEVTGNTQALAWSLYRDYLMPFEIASIFLLVAMIGAVVLGRRQ